MIRTGVSKLLHKSGIDKRLTALLKSDTHINITDPLVTMSYYAVWLFALPMILEAFRFTQPLMQPIQDVINNIFNFVPLLISAGVVFAVFFFAANALRLIITQVLDGIGLTKMMGKMGLQSMVDRVNPTKLAGNIVFIMLVLLGATQAIDILKLPVLSSIVQTVLTISGNVLFGSAIIALWVWGAGIVSHLVSEHGGSHQVAIISRWAIIILVGLTGVGQMGLQTQIITTAAQLIMASLALGFAVAMWLGAKDTIGKVVSDTITKFR